ncbi:hypothetical protein [Paenibacillus zanthoxyli]|uniref:hypothetical protein n=1 Tax=Paenibacillus zanthoxyli TaxID=369399 RepID=UPI000471E9BF|nr:hypothetical protein [Paenibacillus zanthoxyli]
MKQTFQMLSTDLKRAFGSIGFLIAAAGIWIVYYSGARTEMLHAPDVLLLFKYSAGASGINTIQILLCVLPYTTSFCSDWNSKYIMPVVIRSGTYRYAWSKIISCALSSGASIALGILLFILPFTLRIPLVSAEAGNFEAFATRTLGGELLQNDHYIAYFAIYIYLAFLSGAFWSVVGLCASAYISNKFVALFTPFIGLYVLSLITYQFPPYLQLNKVTNGDFRIGSTSASLIYATLLIVALLAVVGFFFVKTVKKRLSNE